MNKIIIDVREPLEFMLGHVAGAINIPLGKIRKDSKKLEAIQKNSKVIVYCQSGGRSAVAADTLQKIGYTNVINGINKNDVTTQYL